jgi:hypothetical protein
MTKTVSNFSKVASWMMAVAFALPMLATAGSASARSQAAILGNPLIGAESNCFNEVSGGVRQVCTGTRTWSIPIVYDNAGGVVIRVSSDQIRNTNVQCQQMSVTDRGLTLRASPITGTDDRGYCVPVAISAHGFGGTWTRVQMNQNTRIFNVHY